MLGTVVDAEKEGLFECDRDPPAGCSEPGKLLISLQGSAKMGEGEDADFVQSKELCRKLGT